VIADLKNIKPIVLILCIDLIVFLESVLKISRNPAVAEERGGILI